MKFTPTGIERFFDTEDIIVSKTDLRGHICYANDIFLKISGYTEEEILGKPHNTIRHPEMPACIFELLWNTIRSEKEIFAYVVNLSKGGDHYWVLAHVTPSYDIAGKHIGYHSNRRVPHPDALEKVKKLYSTLLAEEARFPNRKEGAKASRKILDALLSEQGSEYKDFVFNLSTHTQLETCEQ